MENTVNYSFAYYTKDRTSTADEFAIDDNMMRNVTYDDTITWDCVLRDFINFLSGIYGYDIGESVKFSTFEERLNRIREENNFNSDWPFDDEEEAYVEGEEAPKL